MLTSYVLTVEDLDSRKCHMEADKTKVDENSGKNYVCILKKIMDKNNTKSVQTFLILLNNT